MKSITFMKYSEGYFINIQGTNISAPSKFFYSPGFLCFNSSIFVFYDLVGWFPIIKL